MSAQSCADGALPGQCTAGKGCVAGFLRVMFGKFFKNKIAADQSLKVTEVLISGLIVIFFFITVQQINRLVVIIRRSLC